MAESSEVFRRPNDVITQTVSGELMLVNMETGEFYGLNEVGIRIWDLCDGHRSSDDMAAIIGHEFDAPTEDVRADVDEVLDDLVSEKLLVRVPAEQSSSVIASASAAPDR